MEMSWFLIERLPGLETSPFPNGPAIPSSRSFFRNNRWKYTGGERKVKEEGLYRVIIQEEDPSGKMDEEARGTEPHRMDVESKRGQHERNVPRPRLYRSDFIPSIIRRSPVTFDS